MDNFTFNGAHYLQTNGTAMGTDMAPSYANTLMGKLTQSCFQRFIIGANSPESKSLTVLHALSHMRRMTPARQKGID
jgi:hypothetical protein